MRVLGIDPGYATVGLGVVDYVGTRFSVVYYGAIVTQPNVSFDVRLEEIYDDTRAIIERVSPDAVSVEKLFFNTNQKTAIAVAQARGAIVLAVKKSGVPIFEYTPLQVKQAVVGYGRAEKLQVMDMTRRILGLERIPRPEKKSGVPIFEYTPLQVKQAVVGYGRAEKLQVMDMTRRILGLERIPRPDDAADALALAICHSHTSGSRLSRLV